MGRKPSEGRAGCPGEEETGVPAGKLHSSITFFTDAVTFLLFDFKIATFLSISKNRSGRKSLEKIPWPVNEGVFKGMRDGGL